MSNLNNSEFEQMLYSYIDGELPASQESLLFAELEKNENLRIEMNDLLAMREAVKNDDDAYTPPPLITQSIYKRIGLIPPIGIGAPIGLWIYRKYLSSAAAVVIVSILSYLGYQSFFNNNQQDIPKTDIKIEKNIPSVSSDEIENIKSNKIINNKISSSKNHNSIKIINDKNLSETNTQEIDVAINNSLLENNTDNQILNIDFKLNQINNSGFYSNSQLIGNSHINSINPNLPGISNDNIFSYYKLDISKIKLYDISVKGMYSAASFPSITKTDAAEPFITNMSVGLYMHQWNNFKLGVEFGQEPFGQQFKDQSEVNYVNKSSLLWAGIGVNAILDNPLLNKSQLFSRVLLGSSEVGPLGKLSLGVQYQPEIVGYSLQLGVEGSLLSYQNQGVNYLTKKISIIYGISWVY